MSGSMGLIYVGLWKLCCVVLRCAMLCVILLCHAMTYLVRVFGMAGVRMAGSGLRVTAAGTLFSCCNVARTSAYDTLGYWGLVDMHMTTV